MFPAATAAPFQAAVVKTGFDVMRREGTGYAKVIVVDAGQDLMQRLHYVPGGHGNPGSAKRNTPWDFGNFSLRIQVWLGFDTFSHGLSRYP